MPSNYIRTKDKSGKFIYWRVTGNGKQTRVSEKTATGVSPKRSPKRSPKLKLSKGKGKVSPRRSPKKYLKLSKSKGKVSPRRKTPKKRLKLSKGKEKVSPKSSPVISNKEFNMLLAFPPEMFLEVILQMDGGTVKNLCSSSKVMKKKCGDWIWRDLVRRDFGEDALNYKFKKTWKGYYQHMQGNLIWILERKPRGWKKLIKDLYDQKNLYISTFSPSGGDKKIPIRDICNTFKREVAWRNAAHIRDISRMKVVGFYMANDKFIGKRICFYIGRY